PLRSRPLHQENKQPYRPHETWRWMRLLRDPAVTHEPSGFRPGKPIPGDSALRNFPKAESTKWSRHYFPRRLQLRYALGFAPSRSTIQPAAVSGKAPTLLLTPIW